MQMMAKPYLASIALDTDFKHAGQLEYGSVSVIDDLKSLEALRDCWRMMQWHPNADIDFYIDVVRAWGDRCRPHVLVISRNSLPEALLVGRAEVVSIDCRLGYKTLFKVKARQLTFIYGGMLGDFSSENCASFIGSIRSSLKQREAEVAEFHFIRTDSDLYRVLCTTERGRVSSSPVQFHRSTIVGSSGEETFNKLSSKLRKNLRWKKLLNDFEGRLSIFCFHSASDMAKMLADVESIACKTYHRQLGVGFDGSEELQQRMTAEAKRGRLRAYVLYLAGQPAAFWIATAFEGVLYSDFMGYDPVHAKYSPGMYLITKTLEGLREGGVDSDIRLVDWGLGDAQYKQVLGDSNWTETSVRIFGSTVRGIWLKLVTTPVAMADAWFKRVLSDSGALQSIKTKWRRELVAKAPKGE
jgi:hypothetical protein